MTRPTPTCRRGHKLAGKNVRKQTNNDTRVNGDAVKYVTRICVACRKYRAERREAGRPAKDLRRGRR